MADVLDDTDGLDVIGRFVVRLRLVAGGVVAGGVYGVLCVVAGLGVSLGFGFAAGGKHGNGKGGGENGS